MFEDREICLFVFRFYIIFFSLLVVLYGFRPRKTDGNIMGLFEFTVQNKDMSDDTFYVRISSASGVSVHSGHVPSPEKHFIDCKLTLDHEVMEEMLNGKSDPSALLLSGRCELFHFLNFVHFVLNFFVSS